MASSNENSPPEARRLGRSLLQLDLAAEENLVYLLMVVFGTILFATPPMVKLYKHCFTGGTGGTSWHHESSQLEMWDFTDEFDDMSHVKDPLDEENKRGRKGKKKAKKKKSKETETMVKSGL